jgi:hypothetical protein
MDQLFENMVTFYVAAPGAKVDHHGLRTDRVVA